MAEQMVAPPHPAKFSEPIVVELHKIVNAATTVFDRVPLRILDPMAGVGTIHRLRVPGLVTTTGIEIEPEWAEQHPDTIEGDASDIPFGNESFELVMFSPPYGNRMADQFVSKDGTHRITYMHFLGRRLHENSAACEHFGATYCKKMDRILVECKRVVVPGGWVTINVSDFIKGGGVVPVVDFYLQAMLGLRFRVVRDVEVPTKRMKFGANHKLRVRCERVITFQKLR
jgi:hypothetical protein